MCCTTTARPPPGARVEHGCAQGRRAHVEVGVEQAACYSTEPLRETLQALVDFDRVADGDTHLTVGAVNATSGALPPAFPAVRIDGEPYWDGGIYSNTPIEAVLDDKPRCDSLIFAVNVWHQSGPEPASIWQVMGRQKDIQFASRADSHIARQKQIHRLRHVIRQLVGEMPASLQVRPHIRELASWGCRTTMHVVHPVAPRLDGEDHTKDIDFTPARVRARREAGYADTVRMIARSPWRVSADPIEGVIEHR